MTEKIYICTGGCGAVITKEQFDNGLTKCGTEGCKNKGIEFEKRLKCSDCGVIYQEQASHQH